VRQEINIVWFKRDLRFTDNEPLYFAQQSKLPLLLIYLFEPSVMSYDDSDVRHWRFIHESLKEMNEKLKNIHSQLYIFHNEANLVFETLTKQFTINTIFSSQEIGNALTYKRDTNMQRLFTEKNIRWKQYQTNGIIRKLKNRQHWEKLWEEKMCETPRLVSEDQWNIIELENDIYEDLKGASLKEEITARNTNFQEGGEYYAWRYLDSFIKTRHVNYSKHISKPLLSRKGCSRLSPYLTYGNISMRMVYLYTKQHYNTSENKRALTNFVSRLHWHCHFIQKFEDECRYEFENINRAYNSLIKPKNDFYIKAWECNLNCVKLFFLYLTIR
jgi:deoxyribodipyrimidine photo-lyase